MCYELILKSKQTICGMLFEIQTETTSNILEYVQVPILTLTRPQ